MDDKFNRNINYLRLALTPDCNLNCVYCNPLKSSKCKKTSMSLDEITEIVETCAGLGIKKVRLTGGEPLLRNDVVDVCRAISQIDGINDICMTTNGILLQKYAKDLKLAGLNRINISLDSLSSKKYEEITGFNKLKQVLDGIAAAKNAGFENTKINVVLAKGINDGEIKAFAKLTKRNDIQIRFIELMPICDNADWCNEHFLSCDYVLTVLKNAKYIKNDGVAEIYRIKNYKGTIGLINPISNNFCSSCNKIRITYDGKLKPCLHSAQEIDLTNLSKKELLYTLHNGIYNKPEKHLIDENNKKSNSLRNMNMIGG